MCRLFGMSAAPNRVAATFWLIDAPDSLALQSRREPDGVGLGVFEPDGTPLVYKQPVAAYQDSGFAREAHELSAATSVYAVNLMVATERMDEDPGWRALSPGELLHVAPAQGPSPNVAPGPEVSSRIVLPDPPAHPVTPRHR